VGSITIGPLSDGLGDLEQRDIFFVSEVAALLRALVTNMSFLVVLAVLLLVATYFVLWRTAFGLRLRSCGENPASAESLGVDVLRYIFGNWRPTGLLAGSGLFGYTETLGLRQGGTSVRALLLVLAVLLVVLAVWLWRRSRYSGAGVAVVVAILVGGLYFTIDTVPGDFTRMTPYVATLLVLALASQRLRMPAANGQIYRRGSVG
jgi:simple sugar transport system permease protein